MMQSKLVPNRMMTGPSITMRHSHSIITINDNSEREYPNVISNDYSVFQPIFSPKGITDQLIYINGSDVLNNYIKLFGKPNTRFYGPMATYAYRAIQSGFKLGVINIAPKEATYSNFYIGLTAGKAKDENGNDKLGTLYVEYDVHGDYYHMSMNEDDLPHLPGEPIHEIQFPLLEVGFKNYTITGLNQKSDLDRYMTQFEYNVSVGDNNVVSDSDNVHVPIIGLAYRGRGNNNGYSAVFYKHDSLLNNAYNYFNCSILNQDAEEEFTFDFALFDVVSDTLYTNQSFFNRATKICKITFSTNNSVQIFRPYSISRTLANKITDSIALIANKFRRDLLRRVQQAIPNFIPELVESDWYDFTTTYDSIIGMFTKSDTLAARTKETPLTNINPFMSGIEDVYAGTPVQYVAAPTTCAFDGGTLGSLGTILEKQDFDWNLMLDVPSAGDKFILGNVTISDTTIKIGDEVEVIVELVKEPAEQTQFFLDELTKCYTGDIDDNVFDPSIMRDAICFGENYPQSLQVAVADFVRYRQGVYNFDQGRCDCCYIRTPNTDMTDFADILEWGDGFGAAKNMNMHPVIGNWDFLDDSTGSVERFSSFYDYLGSTAALYNYLVSYTTDSFASGDYSKIIGGQENTQRLIPSTKEMKEELALRDFMFYYRRTDGYYYLSEDSAYIPNIDSVMKSVGSNIHFNRIMNELYCFLRDNKIIRPTAENLNILTEKMKKRVAAPVSHFGNNFTLTAGMSTIETEAARDVVVYDVRITGNSYSRHNRLEMNIERTTDVTAQ